MKKSISYALTFILLLNVMGYYGVFLGLQYQNDLSVIRKFEADQYAQNQTVTIKIPLVVPYFSTNGEFERVDGKFEHEGKTYRLIKHKYANDTLTVVCYKDFQDQRINNAIASYVKTFADSPDEGTNSKITISFIKDYLSETFSIETNQSGWQSDVSHQTTSNVFIPSFTSSFVHPPQRG